MLTEDHMQLFYITNTVKTLIWITWGDCGGTSLSLEHSGSSMLGIMNLMNIIHRIDQLAMSDQIIMIYHFVSGECFCNSELAIIYRRFIQKVIF